MHKINWSVLNERVTQPHSSDYLFSKYYQRGIRIPRLWSVLLLVNLKIQFFIYKYKHTNTFSLPYHLYMSKDEGGKLFSKIYISTTMKN